MLLLPAWKNRSAVKESKQQQSHKERLGREAILHSDRGGWEAGEDCTKSYSSENWCSRRALGVRDCIYKATHMKWTHFQAIELKYSQVIRIGKYIRPNTIERIIK